MQFACYNTTLQPVHYDDDDEEDCDIASHVVWSCLPVSDINFVFSWTYRSMVLFKISALRSPTCRTLFFLEGTVIRNYRDRAEQKTNCLNVSYFQTLFLFNIRMPNERNCKDKIEFC